MATPNRLKSSLHPFFKVARIITPTGIGVLLSIGAHAALIAYGPHTNFSFAALKQENLEANPEETIVPILQLSAAERNRLPSFAQPRRPPASTGLSSLQLPSGLPSFPSSSTVKRQPVPSRPIPSPSTKKPKPVAPLQQALPNRALQPYRFNFPIAPAPSPSRPVGTPVLPTPPTVSPTAPDQPTQDENGLPFLDPAKGPDGGSISIASSGTQSSTQPERGLSEALSGTEDANITFNLPNSATTSDGSTDSSTDGGEIDAGERSPSSTGETEILVENTETIAVLPADGDPDLLLRGYSSAGVSEEAAEENLQNWIAANAGDTTQVQTQAREITIDSAYKACREIPPSNGLIGVLVTPDGNRENVETLKSTGYSELNSLALSTLDYEDFGQPEEPTLYEVEVNVIYEPSDCVEDLPEAPAEAVE